MATRTVGKTKLTPEVRQRLVEVAREARELVDGSAGCPEWGTTFAEIESDAREVATPIGSEDRTLETEAGVVS